jgi:hypothetical protein
MLLNNVGGVRCGWEAERDARTDGGIDTDGPRMLESLRRKVRVPSVYVVVDTDGPRML